ncbi:hypothetical protein [Saccharopolyspora elongata]|uniref:Uncharacterized protein n=1 Tax=Saccharopolyspora elongata TaxID=2530387 RepID=A0A4R4XUA5_9PSEU|nr:hypothetical protein [Saccharopolyspora elongata]TDD35198.1 hypothetical protein E1288_43460 [Saccharopolyspora elongata]
MDDDLTLADVVDGAIGRWQRMRSESARQVADRDFRTWLFETLPEQAASAGPYDPRDHAFIVYETVTALYRAGNMADSFLLLRWYGEHYAHHPDPELGARVIDMLTDLCAYTGRADAAGNAAAAGVLRDVVDAVRGPVDVRVERALCRALAIHAHLRGDHLAAVKHRSSKREEQAALWTEIFRRYRHNTDPELRGRAAQGLYNTALVSLQEGDERAAREKFDELVQSFGRDRGGNPDVDEWLSRAEHAGTVLDGFAVGEPELNLDYLRKQRDWDRRRRRRGFGLPWLLAGAPRNHMAKLVRAAREKHLSSVGQVRSWLCSGEPFVLLLRNFGLAEESGISSTLASVLEDPDDPQGDYVQTIVYRDCGPALAELELAVPMITVASTKAGELDLSSAFGQFVPRAALYLPDATWFETVAKLIPLAAQIIVWAAELTPALAQEIACLEEHGRTADALIIVDEPPSTMQTAFLPRSGNEVLTTNHPALAEFPNVVDAREFKNLGVADSPPLQELLNALEAARAVPIEQRIERIRTHLA